MASAFPIDIGSVLELLATRAERFLASLPLLLVAALVLWLAWLAGRWLSRRSFLDRASRKNPFVQELVRTTVRWAVLLVGFVVALEVLGATRMVGAVLGTAGVLGVALGFAFKDILENYLAGVLMSLRQPFAPRDHVVIDGHEGMVMALTSRATILMTLDGNHLRIPNALVFRSVALNYTRNPLRRLQFDVGMGTGVDLMQAQAIGTGQVAGVPGVAASPPPRSQVMELGDSTVQVRFFAWVDQRTHEFVLVRSEAIRQVKEALDAAGVDMPVPLYRLQREVGNAGAESRPAGGPVPASRTAGVAGIDTRRTPDIAAQIDAEDRSDGDLLDANAPRE